MYVQLRYFKQIDNNEKIIEGRPDYPSYRKYSPGNIIPFKEQKTPASNTCRWV